MRRLFLAATLGILGAVTGWAALNLGMPGAVKSRVKNLDEKVQAQQAAQSLISGTAASGHAIAAQTFTIGDCAGNKQTGTTAADGSFSIMTPLSFPIFLKVGAAPSFYSVAYGAGTANIHPFTDLTLRTYYRSARGITNLDTSFAGQGNFAVLCGPPSVSTLTALSSLLMNTLSPVATVNGINPATYNPFTTSFSANGVGFDAILDQTKITANVDYSTVTITNLNNGVVLSTITSTLSDVVTPATPTGLTSANITTTTVTLLWTPSVSTNVAGYGIYRNGVLIANAPGTTYTDTGLTVATAYSYAVDAFSWINKRSAATAAVQLQTLGGSFSGTWVSASVVECDSGPSPTFLPVTIVMTQSGSQITGTFADTCFAGTPAVFTTGNVTGNTASITIDALANTDIDCTNMTATATVSGNVLSFYSTQPAGNPGPGGQTCSANTGSSLTLTKQTPAGSQTFTANGSFTVPVGVTSVTVSVWGGGGAGGIGAIATPNGGGGYVGGGGGGGGYVTQTIAVTPGTVYTVAVGAGATAPSPSVGGTSSFSLGSTVLVSAAGGASGVSATGTAGGAGANGGAATGGQAGGSGQAGVGFVTSAVTYSCGANGGAGANGGIGGTNGGPNGTSHSNPTESLCNGNNYTGAAPGGGGAGTSGTTDPTAGAGAAGQVIVSWLTDYTGSWNIGHALTGTTGGCVGDNDPSLNNSKNDGTIAVDSSGNFVYGGAHSVAGKINLATGLWGFSGPSSGTCNNTDISNVISATGTCTATYCSGVYSSTSLPSGGTNSGPIVWWRSSSYAGVWTASSTITAETGLCVNPTPPDIGTTSTNTFIVNGSGSIQYLTDPQGNLPGTMNMTNGSWSFSGPGSGCQADTSAISAGSGGSCPAVGPCSGGTIVTTGSPGPDTTTDSVILTR